jgi:hypothetical protein
MFAGVVVVVVAAAPLGTVVATVEEGEWAPLAEVAEVWFAAAATW